MKLLSHLPRRFFLNSLLAMTVTACQAADKAPEEVGAVRWGRDMNEDLLLSAGSGRPIFALFQEVPGCAGCKQFGREVLSHPQGTAAARLNLTPEQATKVNAWVRVDAPKAMSCLTPEQRAELR